MTVIRENAGETVLLEGEQAQKYLQRKAGEEAAKDADRAHERQRYRNQMNNQDDYFEKSKSAQNVRDRELSNRKVAAKIAETKYKRVNMSDDREKANAAGDKWVNAEKNYMNVALSTPSDKVTDAVMRHNRRHPDAKLENCGDK